MKSDWSGKENIGFAVSIYVKQAAIFHLLNWQNKTMAKKIQNEI